MRLLAIDLGDRRIGLAISDPTGTIASPAGERAAVDASLAAGEQELGRRTLLVRLLLGAAAALGVAALFPIRSLGPSPGDTLYRTPWRRGMRLRDETGRLVKAGELEQGSFATVFPETAPGSADGQAVLVRVDQTGASCHTGARSFFDAGGDLGAVVGSATGRAAEEER